MIRTVVGYILLTFLAIGTNHPESLLVFGFLSLGFTLNKNIWNPHHTGISTGFVTGSLILLSVMIAGNDPSSWLDTSENAFIVFAACGLTSGIGTGITAYTRNRMGISKRRLHKLYRGLKKKTVPGYTSKKARRERRSLDRIYGEKDSTENNSQNPEQNGVRDINEEDLRVDGENHNPTSNTKENSTEKTTNNKNENMSKTDNSRDNNRTDNVQSSDREQKVQEEEEVQEDQEEEGITEYEFPWEDPPDMRFEDIGGYSEVKEELEGQVVKPVVTDSESFKRFGITPSRGLLFHGPPGTGKTMFARALANALNMPFVELTQADLTHEYINKSSQIIQRLFEEAEEIGGVIFIDEAEQLLGDRGNNLDGHNEDKKITNTFLSNLTKEDKDFIVLLTTNRRDSMDKAILRPGRIDKEFQIGLPDKKAKVEILKVKLAQVPNKVNKNQIKSLIQYTDGWSGADLNALYEQAKFSAANRDAHYLTGEDLKNGFEAVRDDIDPEQ